KELYQHRKETIERLFGTAKEYHNLRYTREKGKSKMEDKIGLTLACLNLKTLIQTLWGQHLCRRFGSNRFKCLLA
ncbi:transposase, partial [Streptococcus suis]